MKSLRTVTFVFFLCASLSCSSSQQKADAYGNFEVREVIISPEIAGKLLEFRVEEGDLLDSARLIGVIDTSLLVVQRNQLLAKHRAVLSQISSLDAQGKVLQLQVNSSRKELQRVKNLLKDGAATEKNLDDALLALNIFESQADAVQSQKATIRLEADALKFQIDQVLVNMRKSFITSPAYGMVLVKYAEEGEIVMPGKAILKIGMMDKMIIRAYVSGSQLSEIRLGQTALVKIDGLGGTMKEFEGRLEWISSTSEFTPKIVQTRDERVSLVYAVKISVKNDGSLKAGMPGEVYFNIVN